MKGRGKGKRRKQENRVTIRTDRRNTWIRRIFMSVMLICTLILFVVCAILLRRVRALEEKVESLAVQNVEFPEGIDPQMTASEADPETESETETETARERTEAVSGSSAEVKTEKETQDNRRKVYLTFDDGPSGNTAKILDILKRYDVKATFFVLGKTDETSVLAYQRIVEEGHTLAMHSYSHMYAELYESREAFETDLLKLQSYLEEVTGVAPRYYRFPGGSSHTMGGTDIQELIDCLYEHDIEYFDWNVSSGDGSGNLPDTAAMIENVMRDVPKYEHCVVLMHDDVNKNRTVEALGALIETLREQDCVLLPIDDSVQPIQHVRQKEKSGG